MTLSKAEVFARRVPVSENLNCERVSAVAPHRLNESWAKAVAQRAKVGGIVKPPVLGDPDVREARNFASYE